MFLLKDHNPLTPVRLEPAAPQSRVKYSTTEQLRSLQDQIHLSIHSQSFISALEVQENLS